jgi:hypothetical protein
VLSIVALFGTLIDFVTTQIAGHVSQGAVPTSFKLAGVVASVACAHVAVITALVGVLLTVAALFACSARFVADIRCAFFLATRTTPVTVLPIAVVTAFVGEADVARINLTIAAGRTRTSI